MNDRGSIESILKMERIVFDRIEFNREGFKNDNEIELQFEVGVPNLKNVKNINIYKVSLGAKGDKRGEYNLEVCITGFFTFQEANDLDDQRKENLLSKNAVAILMPYLRSQITLLTAQPEVDTVVLPVFNIINMLNKR